jgi:hypothetical protein
MTGFCQTCYIFMSFQYFKASLSRLILHWYVQNEIYTSFLVRFFYWYNTPRATIEAGTAYPSGAHEFTSGVCDTRSLVLSICHFCFGHCVAVVFRFTASDCPFGIFKLVLYNRISNIEYFVCSFSWISCIYLRPDPVRIVYTGPQSWLSVLGTDWC